MKGKKWVSCILAVAMALPVGTAAAAAVDPYEGEYAMFEMTASQVANGPWSQSWGAYGSLLDNGIRLLGGGAELSLGCYTGKDAVFDKLVSMDLALQLSGSLSINFRIPMDSGVDLGNPAYTFVFSPGAEMTVQAYKNTTVGAFALGDAVSVGAAVEPGDFNNYRFGVLNEEDTVRMLLYVNEQLVLDRVDEDPAADMLDAGNIFFQGAACNIAIRGTDVDTPSPLKAPEPVGEYAGIPLYDLSGIPEGVRADLPTITTPFTFTSSEGFTLPYRLYLPTHYDPDKEYALVTHLHGGGGRGTDNLTQINVGINEYDGLLNYQSEEEYILLIPQCPTTCMWSNGQFHDGTNWKYTLTKDNEGPQLRALLELVEEVRDTFAVDARRMYLHGASMGGMASLDILARHPGIFAAAVIGCPINSHQTLSTTEWVIENLQKTPIYLFHGALDDVLDAAGSQTLADALTAAGAKQLIYEEVPDKNHGNVLSAQQSKKLLPWLFRQKLADGQGEGPETSGSEVSKEPLPTGDRMPIALPVLLLLSALLLLTGCTLFSGRIRGFRG